MDGIYGCGCKEVYRFPHITYPYYSCIYSFWQQHPTFLLIFLIFFVLYIYIFLYEQKVVMLLQKRKNTREGIGSMRKYIYLLTTTPIDSTLSH